VIYQTTISTPKDDYVTSPLRTVLKVAKGLVYKVEVDFPPGPQGLLKVVIYDGGHQRWPSTPGEYFALDNYCVSFDDTFLKLAAPFQFDILTWNECESYPHTVTVRLGMVSKDLYIARFLPTVAYEEMLRLIRVEQAEQEAEREAIIETPFSWLEPEEEGE